MIGRARDSLNDTVIGLMAAFWRSLAVIIACSLGVAGLVASQGISETASFQVDDQLDLSKLDEVRVTPNSDHGGQLSTDLDARAKRLTGVREAGIAAEITESNLVSRPGITLDKQQTVKAVTSGYLTAVAARWTPHVPLTAFSDTTHVALVGHKLLKDLGIAGAQPGLKLHIGQRSFYLAGILTGGGRDTQLEKSVVIPFEDAATTLIPFGASSMLVIVEPGAAEPVADVVAAALDPIKPNRFIVTPPPTLESLRTGVRQDLSRLLLALSILLTLVAIVGIASAMMLNIHSRTSEFGLRRALGQSMTDIAVGRVIEGGILGFVGGLSGTAVGILGVVSVASANQWTAVLNRDLVGLGVVIGVIVGTASALLPAIAAARIQPSQALRR